MWAIVAAVLFLLAWLGVDASWLVEAGWFFVALHLAWPVFPWQRTRL